MSDTARINVVRQYDNGQGYGSYVYANGSTRPCASYFAATYEAAYNAALRYCQRYDLTITGE